MYIELCGTHWRWWWSPVVEWWDLQPQCPFLFLSLVLAHKKYIISVWNIITEAIWTAMKLFIYLCKVVVEWVIHILPVRLRKAFQTGHSHLLWFRSFSIGGGQRHCWVIRLHLLPLKLESYLILTDAQRVDNIYCPCQACCAQTWATAWLGINSATFLCIFFQ